MKYPHVFLIVLLFTSASMAMAQTSETDSLKALLSAVKDTTRVNVLGKLGYRLAFSDPPEADKYLRESIDLAKAIDFKKGQAYAYMVLGISLDLRAQYAESTEAFTTGSLILKQLDTTRLAHRELRVGMLNGLGLAHYHQSNYKEALTYFLQALPIAEKISNKSRLAAILVNVGLVYHDLDEVDRALEYYRQALTLSEESRNKSIMARAANNIGILYERKGSYAEAIRFYELSLGKKRELNDLHGVGSTLTNLASINKRIGKLDVAMSLLDEAVKIRSQVGDQLGVTTVNDLKAEIYILKKEFKRAKGLVDSNYQRVRQIGTREPMLLVYQRYVDLYKAQKNYGQAIHWIERKNLLYDSLFNEKKSQQIAELETRFQTEKKEQTIKFLEQEKHLQHLWRYGLMAVIVLISAAAIFIIGLQRSRAKKARQLLEVQRVLNEKLNEIDKAKSDFFANISHEFRTPLTLIKGPIHEFLTNPAHALTPDKARMIYRNSNRLLQLVNQLLDLSRVDSGMLHDELKNGDIHQFLRVIVSMFSSHAQQRNMEYIIHIPEEPFHSSFDHNNVEKILYNLLSNAFKFTPDHGTVEVTAAYKAPTLKIEVADNGKGIEARHLGRVFDRFYRADETNTAGYEGTGIGLALVKELTMHMGGTVSVESIPHKRTSFTVEIPLHECVPGPVEEVHREEFHLTSAEMITAHDTLAGMPERDTILVVEDNADMRSFIASQLCEDYTVQTAPNGKQGIDLAVNSIPDLIITDVMMPEMDGLTFCGLIKNNEHTSHIPVIMLTAKGRQESKLEGLETGADDYLIKPFDKMELLARVKNLIEQRRRLSKKYSQQITLGPREVVISSADEKFLAKLEAIIEQNLAQSEFGVPQLQDFLAMSKMQLHRKMKALTNQPPGEFLRNYRLKRAVQMLEKRTGNITEIAFAVGFGSLPYFTRSFTDLFGKPPSEYTR